VDDLVILQGREEAFRSRRASLQQRAAGLVRDVILGGQDGLVNVLGLVLGMAVATGDTLLVTTAGLAALLAESIAMAGVAFTATGAERALGQATRGRLAAERAARTAERREALATRLEAASRADDGLEERSLQGRTGTGDARLVDARLVDAGLVDLVTREVELEAAAWREEVARDREALAPIRETRPIEAAMVVGLSTAFGSSVPLLPFVILPVPQAAVAALGLGAIVLAVAGSVRAELTGGIRARAALEMVAIGLVSAFAGFLIGHFLRAPAA
jgi:VIT1/CCC1 family predicted Fe2+/Mn2+ transporter